MTSLYRLVVAVTLGAIGVNGFFRMPCGQPVVVERADPIVNPGAVSGHLHTIMGGNGFNFTESYDTAQSSTCSTCKAKQDKSNYWTPTLFYQAQNGSFHQVTQNGGALIYYLQRYSPNNNTLEAFPPGFRMLAGNPSLRSYNASSLEQRAVSWVCLGVDGVPQTPQIPNMNCPGGLRSQVFFPSCWDGRLDASDHKSHVAYPDGMDNGKCPDSHPRRLISIFYEIIWNIDDWKNMWWKSDGSHPFVLSMGDPTGYGHHGDFLNGWDTNALTTAINGCTQNSGVIEDCQNILELYPDSEMNACKNPAQVNEVINGWLDTLPGCNAVQSGPGNAVSQACGKPVPQILPLNEVGFIRQDIPSWDGVGCANDNLNARVFPQKYTDDNMTPQSCTTTCHANGYEYAGLEWGKECWCGHTFDSSTLTLSGACSQPCAGDPNQYCGNGAILAVYHYNAGAHSSSSSSSAAAPPPAAASSTSTGGGVAVQAVTTSTSTSTPANTPPVVAAAASSTTTASTSTSTSNSSFSDWSNMGCYVDTVYPYRSLAGDGMWYLVPMTREICIGHCANKGFEIAGTEYGGECYCGHGFAHTAPQPRPASECSMPCKGNSSQMCGGPARMNVYTQPNFTIPQQPIKRALSELPVKRNDSSLDVTEKRGDGPVLGRRRNAHARRRRALHGRSQIAVDGY